MKHLFYLCIMMSFQLLAQDFYLPKGSQLCGKSLLNENLVLKLDQEQVDELNFWEVFYRNTDRTEKDITFYYNERKCRIPKNTLSYIRIDIPQGTSIERINSRTGDIGYQKTEDKVSYFLTLPKHLHNGSFVGFPIPLYRYESVKNQAGKTMYKRGSLYGKLRRKHAKNVQAPGLKRIKREDSTHNNAIQEGRQEKQYQNNNSKTGVKTSQN